MKKYVFLDGSMIEVSDEVCRGCFLETASTLPLELEPIAMNDKIVIRQDAECAIPGFYIVSTRQHIHSIADMTSSLSSAIGMVIQVVRQGQREILGIERAHIYLEEKLIEPHFHVWILPLFPEIIESRKIEPKIWNSTVKEYLDLFSYYDNKKRIIEFNIKMRKYILNNETMQSLGFAESPMVISKEGEIRNNEVKTA